MSDNYSNSIESRAKVLSDVLFREEIFGEESKRLKEEGLKKVDSLKDRIVDNIDIAMALTNNYGNILSSESGIVQSLLGTAIETAGLEKPWFMQRDKDKMITLYGEFIRGGQFDRMFGEAGYKKIFTGNYEGFMDDFKSYGATAEEIVELELALIDSVFNGVYNTKKAIMVSDMSYRIKPIKEESVETIKEEPANIKDSLSKLKEELYNQLNSGNAPIKKL